MLCKHRHGSIVRLAAEWGNARRLIAIGRHQRVASTRSSFYKRKVASSIDVLTEEGEVEQVPEGAATRVKSSFRDALARWCARRRTGAPSSQQQMHEKAPQTREDHLLLEADVTFVLAGDSNHPADASELVNGVNAEVNDVEMLAEEEDAAGGAVLEARIVACTELWWAIQATRPFAHRKVNKRCVIKAFWLKALGERRWQVLDDAEVSVFRGTLLADPSTGEPFVLPGDDLSASWDGEQLAAVYTFPSELCERLDEAAEAQLRDDDDAQSEGELSEDESTDDEQPAAERAPTMQAHTCERDERHARRAGKTAACNAAAELRQQSLQEVLVVREEARPDQAPASRPRVAADRRWTRARAWEEARAAGQGLCDLE